MLLRLVQVSLEDAKAVREASAVVTSRHDGTNVSARAWSTTSRWI